MYLDTGQSKRKGEEGETKKVGRKLIYTGKKDSQNREMVKQRETSRNDEKRRSKNEKQGRIHGTRCALYAYLSPSKITRDGPTDGPTDGRTEGRTDTTSYRDATAHLKSISSSRPPREVRFFA